MFHKSFWIPSTNGVYGTLAVALGGVGGLFLWKIMLNTAIAVAIPARIMNYVVIPFQFCSGSLFSLTKKVGNRDPNTFPMLFAMEAKVVANTLYKMNNLHEIQGTK